MLEDLRAYMQLASGLTEATAAKAREVASGLLAQGLTLTTKASTKAMSAPEMLAQVQSLADDLLSTNKRNHEALVEMIRTEVDQALAREGFVREDELAALRARVEKIEASE